MFDLQKFADEEIEKDYGDILDDADEFTEETPENNSDIPSELEGIPENIALEIITPAIINT